MTVIFSEHFDGETYEYNDVGELRFCERWTPYWSDVGERARPEAKVISKVAPYLDPPRIPAAETHAQQWFTFYKPHRVGMYAVVPTAPGTSLTANALYHAWCSNSDDPHVSSEAGAYAMYARIGIDPTGGPHPDSPAVVWSGQAYAFDEYESLAVSTVAQTQTATLFIETVAKWGVKHNDAYIANVQMWSNNGAEPPTPPPPPDGDAVAALVHFLQGMQGVTEEALEMLRS